MNKCCCLNIVKLICNLLLITRGLFVTNGFVIYDDNANMYLIECIFMVPEFELKNYV